MIPIVYLPPISLSRDLKPGAMVRYRAESQWNMEASQGGTLGYQYDLNFLILRTIRAKRGEEVVEPEGEEPGLAATFRIENMDSIHGTDRMPRVKLAGVYGVRMTEYGMPLKFQMDGAAGLFGLPLLSWYLPPVLGKDGSFAIPSNEIANGVVADGVGSTVRLAKQAVLRTRIWIGPSSVPMRERVTVFQAETTWDLRTGRLLSSNGSVRQPGGVLTFRIVPR